MKLISSPGRQGKFATRVAAAALSFCITTLGFTACSEKLDSTGGCPTVCGGQTSDVQNETFDAVVLDSTVPGLPGLGTEGQMLLATRPDLDTRIVLRFDTLPSRVRTSASDTTTVPISVIDSALVTLRLDSSGGAILQPVTLSLYNIETTGNDTSVADLAPLFVPGRLIGQRIFQPGTLLDTVTIPIDDEAFVLDQIQNSRRIRIGVQVTSTVPVMVRAYSAQTSFSPSMSFRASADTALPRFLVLPGSKTPTDNVFEARSLSDFTLLVNGGPTPPAGMLAVGGLPAKRTYFRLDVPSRIVDSSIVIRATLLLTQVGNAGPDAADTMRLQPNLVLAGPVLTDPVRASQIIVPSLFALASTLTRPEESGEREIEIAPVFRVWQQQTDAQLPRAIVLSATREAATPQQVFFYSTSAAPALRPRLRVSYTTRVRIGTP